MACRSFCGFQSESKRIHVSAAVKLIPAPKPRGSISSDPDGGHHQSSSGAIRAHPAAISGSTYAPRTRREEEGECGRSRLAEAIDGGLAQIARDRAVQSLKRVSTGIEELREDVEHDRELSRGGEGGRGRGGEGERGRGGRDAVDSGWRAMSIHLNQLSIQVNQSQAISIHLNPSANLREDEHAMPFRAKLREEFRKKDELPARREHRPPRRGLVHAHRHLWGKGGRRGEHMHAAAAPRPCSSSPTARRPGLGKGGYNTCAARSGD